MAFSALRFAPASRPVPLTLGDKLQIIALLSPQDLKALEVLVDLVWHRIQVDDTRTP